MAYLIDFMYSVVNSESWSNIHVYDALMSFIELLYIFANDWFFVFPLCLVV